MLISKEHVLFDKFILVICITTMHLLDNGSPVDAIRLDINSYTTNIAVEVT